MKRSRRGMSLLEAIVALGVAFLLSMTVFKVVLPTFRIVHQNQIHTEIQQQGQLAMEQLVSDLQRSLPTGVSLGTSFNPADGLIVASQPLSEQLNSGTMTLDTSLQLIWHDMTKKQLFRRIYREPDPATEELSLQTTTTHQFGRDKLLNLTLYPNNTMRSLAKSVKEFSVVREGTTGGEIYSCRIKMEKEIPGKEVPAVAEIFRKVMLRNHL